MKSAKVFKFVKKQILVKHALVLSKSLKFEIFPPKRFFKLFEPHLFLLKKFNCFQSTVSVKKENTSSMWRKKISWSEEKTNSDNLHYSNLLVQEKKLLVRFFFFWENWVLSENLKSNIINLSKKRKKKIFVVSSLLSFFLKFGKQTLFDELLICRREKKSKNL